MFGRQKKFKSVVDIKQLSSKVLRQLREDLAASHTTYIKRMNADVIDFESSQRSQNAAMRQMPNEELIRIIQSLKQEILSLRLNEIFMTKCGSQMTSCKSALQVCSLEFIISIFDEQFVESSLPQKLAKILDEMADSIQREIKSNFEIESKGEGSGARNHFTLEIQGMFNREIGLVKMAN